MLKTATNSFNRQSVARIIQSYFRKMVRLRIPLLSGKVSPRILKVKTILLKYLAITVQRLKASYVPPNISFLAVEKRKVDSLVAGMLSARFVAWR